MQAAIIDLARLLGWKVAHTPPVETARGWRTPVAADGKGFPDLLLLRERVVVMEVKGDHGQRGKDTLTVEQAAWLQAFRDAGAEAYEVTPQMWLDGEVEEILGRTA